jgi:hypothetical protein
MSPLSFVTVFTFGELGTVLALVLAFDGGTHAAVFHSPEIGHMLFWLFLGGFVWVIGDIFQQYATKFLGIGRGIPLSNTNQLWGLAWGALVFGELAHANATHRLLVLFGSVVMILGAMAVSTAIATEREHSSINQSLLRECNRYELDYNRVLRAYNGTREALGHRRTWWDIAIMAGAVGVFVWLGLKARVPTLEMNYSWTGALSIVMVLTAGICFWVLWNRTRFS